MIKVSNFTNEVNLKDKGVYIIKHKCSSNVYIGSTFQKEGFMGRWRAHLNGLLRGKGNTVLLNIYKKYGIEGFSFHILERMNNSTEYDVRNREAFWIKQYDSYYHGANCSLDTFSSFKHLKRKPYTSERKKLYSLASTTKKKVYLYDELGNLINTFESSVACDRFFNLRKGRTSERISKFISINKHYYASYELKTWCPRDIKKQNRLNAVKKIVETRKFKNNYKVSEETKNKLKVRKVNIKVKLYTIDGTFVKEFCSQNACDEYLGLTKGTTSKVLKGKAKTLKRLYIPKIIS